MLPNAHTQLLLHSQRLHTGTSGACFYTHIWLTHLLICTGQVPFSFSSSGKGTGQPDQHQSPWFALVPPHSHGSGNCTYLESREAALLVGNDFY